MVKLEVKVVGHPKPEGKWLKQGEEIVPSDEFQIENLEDGTSILVINDVYPDDTGIIKFEAVNTIGRAESTTEFVVEGNFQRIPNSPFLLLATLMIFFSFERFAAISVPSLISQSIFVVSLLDFDVF